MLTAAGFEEIRMVRKGESADILEGWFPGRDVADYFASASIEAVKPNP
jgi:arsenite methyltransferase